MKKILIILFYGILFLNLISAVNVGTNYYIYDNKVLVEHNFDSVSNLELIIPKNIEKLDVNAEYKVETLEKNFLIKINSAENLSINYITWSMIDKRGKKFYFVSKNYLNEFQEVKLVLPETAVLVKEGLIFPEPDEISSDGRSIILRWNDFKEEQILVDYEFIEEKNFIPYIVILIVILFFIGYLIFQREIFKKKIEKIKGKAGKNKQKFEKTKKESLTKNLYEDEKKIAEYLLNKKDNEAWTKEIVRELGISKVKLSRKLRSLEQKELIKKIPYGNENKIRILKK